MMNSYFVQEKVSHDSDEHSLWRTEGSCKSGTFTYGTANPHLTYTIFARQLWGVI
jgi:hypothetical protein